MKNDDFERYVDSYALNVMHRLSDMNKNIANY